MDAQQGYRKTHSNILRSEKHHATLRFGFEIDSNNVWEIPRTKTAVRVCRPTLKPTQQTGRTS